MGLLRRADAYCAESPNGMYVLTHEGRTTVPGKAAFPLLERLSGFLDGTHELADLTVDLPEQRAEAVRQLVAMLKRHGVVRYVAWSAPDQTPDETPDEFAAEVRFLDYFVDSGAEAFAAYRSQSVLVLGTGEMSDAVVAAAKRTGLRNVRAVASEPGNEEELDGADLVLHVGARSDSARALDELCARRGSILGQAIVLGDQALITRSDRRGSPATSALLRSRSWRGRSDAEQRELPGMVVTAIANQLVHQVFTATVAASEAAVDVRRLDLSTLAVETQRVVPHPYSSHARPLTEEEFRQRIVALQQGERIAPESFSQRAAALRGSWTGVFDSPTEREFAQIPLHVSEIAVSDPVNLLGDDAQPPRVVGVGWDFATARYDAALRAFAVYASLMVDPRRTDHSETDVHAALRSLRHGHATVLGYGLADGEIRPVRVTKAFPALRDPHVPYTPPAGVGVGFEWAEAVSSGLLGQCRERTLREIPRATTAFSRLDVPTDDRAAVLLRVVGERVTAYDVTGSVGVPTVVCYLGDVPAGCGCALSLADAVAEALEQALLHYQAREHEQPEYLPRPVPDIPEHLRGTKAPTRRERLDVSDVVRALAGHDQPIAVPLDHDPEVHAVMPYVVHVVLADD